MAGTAASDEFDDRQRFRGFYRTEISSTNIGPALAEMAQQFNWMQMAVITEQTFLFSQVCDLVLHTYLPIMHLSL